VTYTAGDFNTAHIYVQWGGKLPGNEQWSCGVRLRKKVGFAVIADAATLLAGVGAAVSAMHTSSVTNLGTGAKLSYVKVNAIGVDGHYLDPAGTTEATYADLAGGGTVPQTFPNQIAMAVTLTTGFSRGPAHKGRFYLPLFNSNIDAGGLIPAGNAASLSTAIDTFITSINAVDANFEMAVFSRKLGAAGNRKVTGNLIGRAIDTQRRRRRSLVEDYQ
jgi:hypothetical protein